MNLKDLPGYDALRKAREAYEANKGKDSDNSNPDAGKTPDLDEIVALEPVDFNNLQIEPFAFREQGQTKKALFYFTDSHKSIVEREYERHMSMQEQISLLILHLEGKLPKNLDDIAKDMLTSYGEWCNQAYETTQSGRIKAKKALIFTEGVTGLDWDKDADQHLRDTLQHSGKLVKFDISSLKLGEWHHFKNIYKKYNPLIKYTHTKEFKDLPEKMQDEARIYLPSPGKIWPVGRGYYDIGYWFYVLGYGYDYGASRGVRSAPQAQTPKK